MLSFLGTLNLTSAMVQSALTVNLTQNRTRQTRNFNQVIVFIRLVCGHDCKALSWLLTEAGGPTACDTIHVSWAV